MAQDEIGHARSLYPLLEDLVGKSPEVEPETRGSFTNAAFLDEAFRNWTDFVAANFLFDTALTVLIESASSSSLAGLAQRARRISQEERLHWLHGEGWTRRLGGEGGPVRHALLASFERVHPDSERLFEVAAVPLVQAGVLDSGAEELHAGYRTRIDPVLSSIGLALR